MATLKFKDFLPTLTAIGISVGVALSPTMQHLIASHYVLSSIFGCLSWLVAHWRPSPLDQAAPSNNYGVGGLAVLILLATPSPAHAQQTTNQALPATIYAAGANYNYAPQASPDIAGTLVLSKLIDTNSKTYSFNAVDLLPTKQGLVSTSVSTGVSNCVLKIARAYICVATTVGVATDAQNVGWAWTGGGVIDIPITGHWGFEPMLRFAKSPLSNGFQFIAGGLVRFGQ